MEGDAISNILSGVKSPISIHALRVEGDEDYAGNFGQAMISIHALRVEGDAKILPKGAGRHGISIHALRVEGDVSSTSGSFSPSKFLSTPSGWRATSL